MLILSSALALEAKPLIEHFYLKPFFSSGFKIYQNDFLTLVITGVGPINAAAAIGYAFGKFQDKISAFLNFGIAGHKDLDIGKLVLANKVSKKGKKSFYPLILFENSLVSKEVISIDEIETIYPEDALYEMEAFSSFEVAARFLPFELIHSVKVISDNKNKEAGTIAEKEVLSLIQKNIEQIENLILEIAKIAKNYSLEKTKDASLFENFHFTVTEKYELKTILSKLKALSKEEITVEEFKGKSAKEILLALREKLTSKPINIT